MLWQCCSNIVSDLMLSQRCLNVGSDVHATKPDWANGTFLRKIVRHFQGFMGNSFNIHLKLQYNAIYKHRTWRHNPHKVSDPVRRGVSHYFRYYLMLQLNMNCMAIIGLYKLCFRWIQPVWRCESNEHVIILIFHHRIGGGTSEYGL